MNRCKTSTGNRVGLGEHNQGGGKFIQVMDSQYTIFLKNTIKNRIFSCQGTCVRNSQPCRKVCFTYL